MNIQKLYSQFGSTLSECNNLSGIVNVILNADIVSIIAYILNISVIQHTYNVLSL